MGDHEEATFPCGRCGEPIRTQWDKSNGSLLRGEYELFGEVFFHLPCLDKHIEPLVKAREALKTR